MSKHGAPEREEDCHAARLTAMTYTPRAQTDETARLILYLSHVSGVV